MKKSTLVLAAAALAVITFLPTLVAAQNPRPYHDGTVWQVSFIRMKPGMDDRYLNWVASDWKNEQEAMKKAGYILSYKVIETESHSPNDFNLVLMTEFKDLATLEANAPKMEELGLKLAGGTQKMESGYQDRSTYREVLGERLGREIILTPKP